MQFPFVRRPIHRGLLVALFVAITPGIVFAAADDIGNDDGEPARIFSTPAERREAGVKHQLIENLSLRIFAELEYVGDRFRLVDSSSRVRESSFGRMLQLGLVATPRPWLELELVYQYEADKQEERHSLDEAIVSIKVADFEGEFGKLYLPFGIYFSRFISGPLLEFGETRAQGAVFSHAPNRGLNLFVFLYKGQAETLRAFNANWGGGFAVEATAYRFLRMGVSYASNLAAANQCATPCDTNFDGKRIAGAAAYVVAGGDPVEVTAEYLTALRAFQEPGSSGYRPRAWNVEVALFPQAEVSVALRLEGSADLKDAPSHRAGVSLAWRVARNASVALEYLRSSGTFEDASGRAVDRGDRVGAQLSLSF